jgi:nicotinamidase-related amidase
MATRRDRPAATALLLVDFIHALVADGGPRLPASALKAARNTALLKQRARRARMPVIYANDHFGNWKSDFPSLVRACRQRGGYAGELAALLEPGPEDFSVLKPRHSAFYGTPLEFLLDELGASRLILAGIEADICVMYTAQDAYMRKFRLWVPRNCVASRSGRRLAAALEFMGKNLKADTRPAAETTPLGAPFRN